MIHDTLVQWSTLFRLFRGGLISGGRSSTQSCSAAARLRHNQRRARESPIRFSNAHPRTKSSGTIFSRYQKSPSKFAPSIKIFLLAFAVSRWLLAPSRAERSLLSQVGENGRKNETLHNLLFCSSLACVARRKIGSRYR